MQKIVQYILLKSAYSSFQISFQNSMIIECPCLKLHFFWIFILFWHHKLRDITVTKLYQFLMKYKIHI